MAEKKIGAVTIKFANTSKQIIGMLLLLDTKSFFSNLTSSRASKIEGIGIKSHTKAHDIYGDLIEDAPQIIYIQSLLLKNIPTPFIRNKPIASPPALSQFCPLNLLTANH